MFQNIPGSYQQSYFSHYKIIFLIRYIPVKCYYFLVKTLNGIKWYTSLCIVMLVPEMMQPPLPCFNVCVWYLLSVWLLTVKILTTTYLGYRIIEVLLLVETFVFSCKTPSYIYYRFYSFLSAVFNTWIQLQLVQISSVLKII